MIRNLLKRAADAVKAEAKRWLDPTPPAEPETVPATPAEPTKPATSKWSSASFHVEALKSPTCPECSEPKKAGWYMCQACSLAGKKETAK